MKAKCFCSCLDSSFISLHNFQGLWNTLLFRCKFSDENTTSTYMIWVLNQCHKIMFSAVALTFTINTYYLHLWIFMLCVVMLHPFGNFSIHCINNFEISTSFARFNAMLKLGSFLKLEKVSTFTVKSTDLGKISIPSHNERANFESTVWHVENSEVARGLNALRCKLEVDKLEWMNMRKGRSFVPEKSVEGTSGPSNA